MRKNYKDRILYLPPDYANPTLVCWLVQDLWRAVTFRETSIPHFVQDFYTPSLSNRRLPVQHLTIVTNWSTLMGDVWWAGTTPDLHLPVLNAATVSLF